MTSPSAAQKLFDLCATGYPVWMGILNATPDSFSDGGQFQNTELATQRARELINAGAHIIDVGGVSTRPGSEAISAQEELSRVIPIAQNIRAKFPSAILSIDTYQPFVARKLAENGLVDLINDVYAGRYLACDNRDTTLHVARDFHLGISLMHMLGEPKTMQQNPHYENCVEEVAEFLKLRAQIAKSMGVKFICVDPGIGFGKTRDHNLSLLSRPGIDACANLGFPLLIGLSRKRFLSELYATDSLDMTLPQNRDARSKELEIRALEMGATIIRSHKMPQEIPA